MANKEMLINVSEGEECRIALVEGGRLEELYMERTSSTSHVGNVYKGRVTNVEPSIQAAFIDFGLGRNGFLHISDLMPSYFGGKAEEVVESVGRKMARRDRPPIQKCLKRGDEIIVQIIKEGIGTKGPTLSTYISIPGRILVMMPGMTKLGVSRKIEDEEERKRLRTILDQLKPPKDCGFIIRTAGIGKTKMEIDRDLKYLTRLYENMNKRANSAPGPMELYAEGDLVTRTVRDVMTSDVDRIIVDHKEVAKKIKDFFKLLAPRTKSKVELFEEPLPLFHKYGIEQEIELMYSRYVPLPSGGSLVIDSTEAIVAIDVNSGKFRDHADAETTAFRTDLEAADEIPRQLRLRDLGGVIICDFIDLRFERHRRELEKRLHDNLKNDRAKTKMLRMSQFGIIEMTRQRMRPSLKRSIYSDCPHCHGAGLVKTPESMSIDAMRRLQIAASDQRVVRIEITVSGEVAFYLQNRKRSQIASMESESGKRIVIRTGPQMALDDMRLDLFDARDGLVYLPELGQLPEGQPVRGRPQQGHRQQRDGGRGGRDRRDQRDQQPQRGGRHGGRRREEQPQEEDRYAEDVEEQIDQREEERAEQAVADAAVEAPFAAGDAETPGGPERGEMEDVEEAPAPVEDLESEEDEASPVSEDVEPEPVDSMPSHDLHSSELEPIEPGPEDGSDPQQENEPAPEDDGGDEGPNEGEGEGPGYEEDEEIELQPAGITHERPTLKEQAGGGRRGPRGGRAGRGGRPGRGGHQQGGRPQPKPDLAPARREGEMSLAERWALEEAAERARRQGGGGGGHQPQHHRSGPQNQGGQNQGGQNQGGQNQGGQNQGEGGGRRRRRRRRGRGGRGGQGGHGGQRGDGNEGGGPANGDRAAGEMAGDEYTAGGGTSGTAGGEQAGGHTGRGEMASSDTGRGNASRARTALPASPQSANPSRPQPLPEPAPPVQRTGSTDRHLLHDEPVLPQPLQRPRHVRDLDHIPDDLD